MQINPILPVKFEPYKNNIKREEKVANFENKCDYFISYPKDYYLNPISFGRTNKEIYSLMQNVSSQEESCLICTSLSHHCLEQHLTCSKSNKYY